MRALLLCVVVICALSLVVEAKYVKGSAKGGHFRFLSKFCYSKVPKYSKNAPNNEPISLLQVTVKKPSDQTQIALYDDSVGRWPDIYHHSMSCEDKLAKANQVDTIDGTYTYPGPRDVVNPHFWYLVAINCNKTVSLDYEITMENNWGNNKWIEQFSCDEIGLEGLYIFYFVFYFILGFAHAYAVYTLIRSDSYHTIVKILTTTITLEALSIFCLFIHYVVYQHDGVGAPALKGLGEMLNLLSQIVLIFLLTLIAKGWCISKMKLDDSKIVLGVTGALTVAYMVMFIWENAGLDPASTIYIYQSAPGIIILVVRGLAMLWFIWCVRSTFMEENHPSKRQFYLWFGIMFTAWYLALPLITIIASGVEPWYRQKTVTIIYVTTNALAMSGLSFLLWPTRASEYFQISSRLDLAGTIPYDSI